MNRKHKKKLITFISLIVILSIAAGFILYALKQNINLFYTPSQLLQLQATSDHALRLGGYVKEHSVKYDESGTRVDFIITDKTQDIAISYQGVLPNLFREGQTVVVTGKRDAATHLIASEVLAKHDEKYIPKVIADELKNEKKI